MLEILTGAGLALAAGVNAYVPLLILGLSSRMLDFVELPSGWAWLENGWVLGILGALLLLEIVADKIPVVDSVNDWVQTVIRPAAGGLAFGSGSSTETVAVTDPAAFIETQDWVPIAIGAGMALLVHLVKMSVRPVLNAVTGGIAAPLVSVAEDVGSVVLSVLALLAPVLVIVAIPLAVWGIITAVKRSARKRKAAGPKGPAALRT